MIIFHLFLSTLTIKLSFINPLQITLDFIFQLQISIHICAIDLTQLSPSLAASQLSLNLTDFILLPTTHFIVARCSISTLIWLLHNLFGLLVSSYFVWPHYIPFLTLKFFFK